MRTLRLAFIFVVAAVASTNAADKEGLLNRLLAPGKLIQGHVEMEKTGCLQCHDAGKGTPDVKCLDCHKEISALMNKKKSYHGRQIKKCFQCHGDHKGRDFDSTIVNQKTFDHKQTGFILGGKHAKLKCAECHKEVRKEKHLRSKEIRYIGATSTCQSCHAKQDIHHFVGKWAKKDCDSCHDSLRWKGKVKFSHNKDTKYKLIGKHITTKCQACHNPPKQAAIYSWPELSKTKCLSCHENVHEDKMNPKFLSGECVQCHSAKLDTWSIKQFNHEITQFSLKGAHAKLKCLECHKQSSESIQIGPKAYDWASNKGDCVSCHEDIHKYRLSPKFQNACMQCHGLETWKIEKFDHASITKFELKGAHSRVKCVDCHKQTPEVLSAGTKAYDWTKTKQECASCHSDFHMYGAHSSKTLQLMNCATCHNEEKWTSIHDFTHNTQTRFPLDGKHSEIKCNDCHVQKGTDKKPIASIYYWPELQAKPCESCHQSPHSNSFSADLQKISCQACHGTKDWKTMTKGQGFEHEKNTRFPLTGKHTDLACRECHSKGGKEIYKFEGFEKKFCVDCHENIHNRQFSKKFSEKACSDCHSTTNFTDRTSFDHSETRYKLRDKHLEVKCEKCHTPTAAYFKKPVKVMSKFVFSDKELSTCMTCHTKDPHKGNYGNLCGDCHNEKGWGVARDFHKNFTLTGVHYSLRCVECHKDGRHLGGMSNNCMICHQKDDIHSGGLPKCSQCHRQDFWENNSFTHAMTHFPLRGSHRALDCSECHNSGVYRGTPSTCNSPICHPRSSVPVTASIPHNSASFDNCSNCHNQFAF